MNRERVLKLVMVLVGLLFVAAVYPMIGAVLHAAQLDTGDWMMMSQSFHGSGPCSSQVLCRTHREGGAAIRTVVGKQN